jgi:hypothetical protein
LAQDPTVEPVVQDATVEPTVAPTVEPTVAPTVEPTVAPTVEPTVAPTEEPTVAPTEEPTVAPTEEPTVAPTEEPTVAPTVEPTAEPTVAPTVEPTVAPTIETTAGDIDTAATASWSTTMAVMNTGSTTLTGIGVNYYKEAAQGGTAVTSAAGTFSLAAFASKRLPASTDIADTTFKGSAVLQGTSADLAASVFVYDSANTALDMYSGTQSAQANTTLLFAVAHRQSTFKYYSIIAVQNTGSVDATARIDFRTDGLSTVVYSVPSFTVPANSTRYFDTQDASFAPLNTNSGKTDWFGSATVVSENGQKLVANLLQYNAASSFAGVHTPFVDTEKAKKWYIGVVHAQASGTFGWNGWIFVANPNATAANVTVSYINSNSAKNKDLTLQVPANASKLFYGNDAGLPALDSNWVGAAIVNSDLDVYAVYGATNLTPAISTNMFYLGKGTPATEGGVAYSKTKLFMPYYESRSPNYVSWSTVQNVGTVNATVDIKFYNLDGTVAATVAGQSIAPGAAYYVNPIGSGNNPNTGLTNWSGSVVIESTNGQPISGYSSIFENSLYSTSKDVAGAYEAFKK